MYAKSTIQLYQEHVKRIKRYMLDNDLIYYSSKVADQYYKEVVESKDYNDTTKRYFRTVIRRLNDIYSGAGFVHSIPRKDLSVPKQYQSITNAYLKHCHDIGNHTLTVKCKERLLHLFFTYLVKGKMTKIEDITSSDIIQFSLNISNKEFFPELRDF